MVKRIKNSKRSDWKVEGVFDTVVSNQRRTGQMPAKFFFSGLIPSVNLSNVP